MIEYNFWDDRTHGYESKKTEGGEEYIKKSALISTLANMYARMSENDYEALKDSSHDPRENIMVSTMLAIEEDLQKDTVNISNKLLTLSLEQMDFAIPQHFSKEQSQWIKTYCIKRNLEFYNQAIDDTLKWLANGNNFLRRLGTEEMLSLNEIAAQLKK